jgi:hypothetical protein
MRVRILLVCLILLFAGRTLAAAPAISSLSPASGAVGASVTISGSNFGSSQGASTVKFNGKTATISSWSASTIVLSGHFKTGHVWSGQNRPYEIARNKVLWVN